MKKSIVRVLLLASGLTIGIASACATVQPNTTSPTQTQSQGQGQGQEMNPILNVAGGNPVANATGGNPTANAMGGNATGGKADSNSAALSSSNSSSSSKSDSAAMAGAAAGVNASFSVKTGASNSTSSLNVEKGAVTNDVKSGDANSTALAAGGQSQSTSAGGNATLEGSGNGGGATVSNDTTNNNTDNSRSLVFLPVQPAALPATIAVGGLKLEAIGTCGPRYVVKPFERDTHVPQMLGLWNHGVAVQTMHGVLQGPDLEKPFVIISAVLPAPFNKRIDKAIGHQLYVTVGSDGQGGGSGGSLNHAANEAWGAGATQSANSSYGVVGVVAVDCEFDVQAAVTDEIKIKTEKFVTGKKEFTGPYTPKETDSCPKTMPDGKVVQVKKTSPEQKCGSRLVTEEAVVTVSPSSKDK